MLNYFEIYRAYKKTNLYNYTLECLNSKNKFEQEYAMNKISKQNFKNENDVAVYVAMNI